MPGMIRYNRLLGVMVLGIWGAACSDDGLPDAPALCQAPLTALTPWWSYSGDYMHACTAGADLTTTALQARGGVVYYGASFSLCAVDASGIHTIASTIFTDRASSGFVDGVWLDGDRVIYTDYNGAYAVPIAGGDAVELFLFAAGEVPVGAKDFDGTFLYWPTDGGILRRRVTPDGVTENILPGAGGTPIRATGDRVDAMGIGILRRLSLTGGAGAEIQISQGGGLLASTGDLTYVRYALQPVEMAGYGDETFDLGVIDSAALIDRAWTGNVPRIMPNAAAVRGDTLYAGGRLHYHDGAAFVGVVATPLGARTGDVIGCYPTKVVSNSEWATVTSVAVDDTGVYAIADRTGVGVSTEYAIVRFPRP